MDNPSGNARVEPPKVSPREKRIRWLAVGLGIAPIIALIALRLTIVSYTIPSGSMTPTILVGDHIFTKRGSPEPPPRGEVIVFAFPENRAQDFISRAIAQPGDTLQVLDGRPILNGWPVPQCKVGPYATKSGPLTLYIEYLGDHSYGVLHRTEPLDTTCQASTDCGAGQVCAAGLCGITLQGPYRVPSDQAWVMGDNRDNAFDSRAWSGGVGAGVPFNLIHAHAGWIWMSEPGGGDRSGKRIDGPPVLPPAESGLTSTMEKCLRERPPLEKTTPPPPP